MWAWAWCPALADADHLECMAAETDPRTGAVFAAKQALAQRAADHHYRRARLFFLRRPGTAMAQWYAEHRQHGPYRQHRRCGARVAAVGIAHRQRRGQQRHLADVRLLVTHRLHVLQLPKRRYAGASAIDGVVLATAWRRARISPGDVEPVADAGQRISRQHRQQRQHGHHRCEPQCQGQDRQQHCPRMPQAATQAGFQRVVHGCAGVGAVRWP